jgi:hypothetical protein
MPAERVKFTDAQKAAIDAYNKDLPKDDRLTKKYAADRAQWLNEKVFEPSGVEFCLVPSRSKLRKALADSRRVSGRTETSEATSSMSQRGGAGPSRSSKIGGIFKVSVDEERLKDVVSTAVTEEMAEYKDYIKQVLREMGVVIVRDVVNQVVRFITVIYYHITTSRHLLGYLF